MPTVQDDKYGALDVPSDELTERAMWDGLLAAAGILAAIAFAAAKLLAHAAQSGFDDKHRHCVAVNGPYACADRLSLAWPEAHPWLTALVVGVAVIVIGRLYVFMRRLETRSA